MTNLTNLFPDITSSNLIKYLLAETGQEKCEVINHLSVIELLKLKHFRIDISRIPPDEVDLEPHDPFRAMLYYPERVIATDYSMSAERQKFSICHEIAHYVLPNHQDYFYLCLESDLNEKSGLILEREANQFAADMLFNNDLFAKMANDMPISAVTVKKLKEIFQASFESTARRLVEKNMRPCLLIVYEKKPPLNPADSSEPVRWDVRYRIYSQAFLDQFKVRFLNDPMNPVVANLGNNPWEITDTVKEEIIGNLPNGQKVRFEDEYFTNTYNVFRIMIPKEIIKE